MISSHSLLKTFKLQIENTLDCILPPEHEKNLKKGKEETTKAISYKSGLAFPMRKMPAASKFTLYEVWLPKLPLRCFFQLSPKPTGTLRAASLSSAAALFLWMRINCSGLSGDEGRRAGLLRPARAWRGWPQSPQRRLSSCSGPLPGTRSFRPHPNGPGQRTPFAGGFRPK